MLSRFARRAVALLGLVVALSACEARVDVDIQVDADGSGAVQVVVTVDREVLDYEPELRSLLRLDDLRAAGWAVSTSSVDGGLVLTATRPFAAFDQLDTVLADIDGHGRLFGRSTFRLEQRDAVTTYRFHTEMDLDQSLALFGEDATAALLDGEPYGVPREELETRTGSALEDAVRFHLTASLLDVRGSAGPGPLALGDGGVHVVDLEAQVVDDRIIDAQDRADRARAAVPRAVRWIAIWWAALAVVVIGWVWLRRRSRHPQRPAL